VGLAKPVAAGRVSWPFWKTTQHTTFNPYASRGRYRGGSAVPARRCTITGTPGDDVLHGTPGNDVICGLGGNDTIYGNGGNDIIDGGAGNDRIYGGPGNDILVGGAGNDVVYGGAGRDGIFGGAGNDRLLGGTGLDRIYAGTGQDLVHGGPGPDQIVGEPGADRLYGDAGNDTIVSQDGSRDLVSGGPGKDTAIADRRGCGPLDPRCAASSHAPRQAATDRLTHIEASSLPPLAVGQTCQTFDEGLVVSCQATGQFGNVPENETATFQNTNGPSGQLYYIGLHGQNDDLRLNPGQSGQVGLGGGHYGAHHELWLQANTPPMTTYTVTSIQGPSLPSLAVGQSCTTNGRAYCQTTGQFGNVPENESVSFTNESSNTPVELYYIGLHGGTDQVYIGPGQTQEVGLGGGHYGDNGELAMTLPGGGSSATVTVTNIQPENS
jgi:Ca2+-binding RTX toxin-like protein